MPITALPVLNRFSPTFKTDVDTFFGSQIPTFCTEANTLQTDVNAKQVTASAAAVDAAAQVTLATTQATNAALSATSAASSALTAGAIAWVSGTTYAIGNARFSPANGQTYRRLTAGAGTTDPSADATNWIVINGLTSEAIPLPANNLPNARPSLNLNFASSQTVDPRITFTRASTATRVNAKGLIESVVSGVPRIDYDPLTGACKGLLIEEQRTNMVLNSTIDGANLATQSVTVTAVAHTLSFYGTGTVTLSGVSVAGPLVGSGAYPTRSTLTFTPTAGTLALTVTGTVSFCQLEAGAFATSYIQTAGSQVTRAADVASMTGTNFSSWYRADEGSFVAVAAATADSGASVFPHYLSANNGTIGNRIGCGQRTVDDTVIANVVTSSVSQVDFGSVSTALYNTRNSVSLAYKINDVALTSSGVLSQTDSAVALPVVTQLSIGSNANSNFLNGCISRLAYYPERLTNAQLVALSTQ